MNLAPSDFTFVFIAFIPFLPLLTDADVALHMVTTGEAFVVSQGQEMTMECEIFATEFNLFDNPIVWRKRQLSEDIQVNMMGNLVEPFASTQRLRVTYKQMVPNHVFGLCVSEARQEDTGNYSCEISGPQNSVLASVTHQLIVKAPVDQIILSTTTTTTTVPRVLPHGRETYLKVLTMVERRSTPLRCTARGGYPPPEIEIYVNNRKVGDDFQVDRSVTLSETRGLRRIYYETSKWNSYYMAEAADDGKVVKCAVTVPGLASNVSSAPIEVHFAAVITCDNVSSSLGDRNVCLRCEIGAKPPITNLFWIIDDRGSTVREGDNNDLFSVLPMLRTDEIVESQLILRQVKHSSFRKYTLVAENPVGMSTKDVTLQPKDESSSSNRQHQHQQQQPSLANQSPSPSQSNPQNLRSSGFSFLQNDVDATMRHVTTFNQPWTLMTLAALVTSAFR